MDADTKRKLEDAAQHIIETSAHETSSGNWITYAEDIPPSILPEGMFKKHIEAIAAIMREYEAVADVEVTPDGEIDTIMYLAYCPSFEPDKDERDEYPDDREILDPLETRRGKDIAVEKTQPKPTLMEKLAENRAKAARQGQNTRQKSNELEV